MKPWIVDGCEYACIWFSGSWCYKQRVLSFARGMIPFCMFGVEVKCTTYYSIYPFHYDDGRYPRDVVMLEEQAWENLVEFSFMAHNAKRKRRLLIVTRPSAVGLKQCHTLAGNIPFLVETTSSNEPHPP